MSGAARRPPRADALPHLRAVAAAVARPGQPETTFRALDGAMGAAIGHTLFTVLRRHADESERCYTSRPAVYPIGGRKPVTPSAWTERVFGRREPYIGRTAADIRTMFVDHELIASLGCPSVLNLPVLLTRNLQILLEWFEGHSPHGQFFRRRIEYFGLGVHFHF